LLVDPNDAGRVKPKTNDPVPRTAAEEDRMRRRRELEEAAKVRRIYEEMVLKRPPAQLVQIGRTKPEREDPASDEEVVGVAAG
jgi:hypothetical protein